MTATPPSPTHATPEPGTLDARFAVARRAADAVLFEGYVLYPYRASAAKNQLRWQFGVLMPPSGCIDGTEHAIQRTECLLEPKAGAVLQSEVRFLRVVRRTVERALPESGFTPVPQLDVGDTRWSTWDEGVEERAQLSLDVDELLETGGALPIHRPAREEYEELTDAAGHTVGRLVRRATPLDGMLRLHAVELPGPCRLLRVSATVENTSEGVPDAARSEALRGAFVATHVLLGTTSGAFLSLTEPPEWAAPAARECRNERTWPVLAGVDEGADAVLSAPIILEDHPRIAPESPGPLYDATEIDEILALRTATLTDEERREVRGTDPRAAEAVELAASLPPEVWERLHGAIRSLDAPPASPPPAAEQPPASAEQSASTPWWNPAADAGFNPSRDHVVVEGEQVRAGSRVVLRPGRRRTDAQDLFLRGRTALVEAVLHDVDGAVHLAVTIDDDPGAQLRREQGRFLYFQPDELAPLAQPAAHPEEAP